MGIEPHQVLGAVHAAEHALIGLLPLFAICDRWDVGGVSMALHPQTLEPTIFVYDGYPGGAGIAELAFAGLERHIRAAAELVARCPCEGGLPVVRAVAEVRQLERVPRQGRGAGACSTRWPGPRSRSDGISSPPGACGAVRSSPVVNDIVAVGLIVPNACMVAV